MEHIKSAIEFATQSQAADFKSSILAALQDKIQDALYLKKMEIGSKLLVDPEEEQETADTSTDEENVDENF